MRARSGTIWRALGTTLVVLAAASPALAQDGEGPTLRFRAPPGCPDESAVRREIEALLGRPLGSVPGDLSVDAEVVEVEGRWLLRLRAGDLGERDIAGESCAALAQAAALMVGFMIDPAADTIVPAVTLVRTEGSLEVDTPTAALAALELDAPPPAIASRLARTPSAARRLADPGAVAPTSAGRLSIGFGPSFVLDVGTLPSVTAGIGGELVVRYDRLDLRLRGHWVARQRGAFQSNTDLPLLDAGVETEHAEGAFRACGRPLDAGLPALSLCGGLAMGAIFATGYGVTSPRSEAGLISSAVLGAAVPWEILPELDLEVGAEIAIPFVTPTFTFAYGGGDLADVYTPSPVSGRLTITGHIDVR